MKAEGTIQTVVKIVKMRQIVWKNLNSTEQQEIQRIKKKWATMKSLFNAS